MKKRILVAEDSPAQAALVEADLVDAGFEVTVASSGEDALQCLASRSVDLVLSDVVMPGIDGYELCRRAKADHPDLPVVLLTSLTDPIEIVHGLEAGADNFLRKPYEPNQLVSRVQQMLYHREMRASGRATMGLEVVLRDKRFLITAERQQILDMLISSFGDLVEANIELRDRERALRGAEADLRAQLDATERERRRISAVLRAAPTPILTMDAQGRITEVNDHFAALVDVPSTELVGQPLLDAVRFVDAQGEVPPPSVTSAAIAGADQAIEVGTTFDLFIRCGDDRLVPVIARAAQVKNEAGEVIAFAAAINDIGAFAGHDPVTQLPNQALFVDRVARAAERIADAGGWVAVAAIVVHRLARVRESISPRQANELLSQVSSNVRSYVSAPEVGGEEATVGYLGGEVFASVLSDLSDELDAVRRSQLLAERLSEHPVAIGDLSVPMAITVGVAVGDSATDPVRLVSSAVRAARRGDPSLHHTVEVADADVDARADDWLTREAELRSAIEGGQLRVHYQPELDLRTGAPMGVEALVRWEHPDRGLLAPGQFLPLAEEAGLVAALSWHVLEQACRQVAAWRASAIPGASTMMLSVNLDHTQLAEPDVAERVRRTLAQTGMDPTGLLLEITEHGVAVDPDASAHRLRELKRLGVRIAIDDFGTGYSSLAQLRRFPVDFLKVDRSFIDGMMREPEDAAIVAATVRLARTLGLDTIAEGVEVEDQLIKLRLLECDFAQGYFWSKPLPPDELEHWWAANADPAPPAGPDARQPGLAMEVTSQTDDLVSYLTHELRNPLSVITGWASLALDNAPAGMERYLEPVLRQAGELEHRLSTLAEMRDATQGSMQLKLVEADVSEVVATLVADMAGELAPHDLEVRASHPVVCRVDVSRLLQAISNLLVNAAKFSPADSPIEVEVVATDHHVEVAVSDRGPGVPEDRRPELFRRFARLGTTHAGMGVGLYLVRSIARAHGGEVRYEPAEGGGSRFTLRLPRLAAVTPRA